MRFCSKCGTALSNESVHCPRCGAYIGAENKSSSSSSSSSRSSSSSNQTNAMAVAGFICAFFFPLLGLIFSGIGISKSKQMCGAGHGLAVAGLVISILYMVFSLLLSLIYFVSIMAYIERVLRYAYIFLL